MKDDDSNTKIYFIWRYDMIFVINKTIVSVRGFSLSKLNLKKSNY